MVTISYIAALRGHDQGGPSRCPSGLGVTSHVVLHKRFYLCVCSSLQAAPCKTPSEFTELSRDLCIYMWLIHITSLWHIQTSPSIKYRRHEAFCSKSENPPARCSVQIYPLHLNLGHAACTPHSRRIRPDLERAAHALQCTVKRRGFASSITMFGMFKTNFESRRFLKRRHGGAHWFTTETAGMAMAIDGCAPTMVAMLVAKVAADRACHFG